MADQPGLDERRKQQTERRGVLAQAPIKQSTMRFIVVFLLFASSLCCSRADELAAPHKRERGEALAKQLCGACHAVGRTDQSPHLGAPPLRMLDRSLDIDTFMQQLRAGLTSGHPDMPTFRFTRQDAHAFVAYLRSIQAP